MLNSVFSPYSTPALDSSTTTVSPDQLSPSTGYFDILPHTNTQPPTLIINTTNLPQRPILERSIFSSSPGEPNLPPYHCQRELDQNIQSTTHTPINGWGHASKLRQECLNQFESIKPQIQKTTLTRSNSNSSTIINHHHQLKPTAILTQSGPPSVIPSSSSSSSSSSYPITSSDSASLTSSLNRSTNRPSLSPLQSHWSFNRSSCLTAQLRSPISNQQRYSSNTVFRPSGLRSYSNRNENMNIVCYSSNLVAEQV